MEYVVLKENRFGKYYVVKAELKVRVLNKNKTKWKKYIVKQEVQDLRKLRQEWKLTRPQMRSILKNTHPDDWLIRVARFFDASIDGQREIDKDFHPMSLSSLEWVLDQLESHGYYLYYWPEKNEFEASNLALGTFYLKPKDLDLVKFVIPPELKKELLVYLL